MEEAAIAGAFYIPDGERLVPTELTRGPWSPDAQHAGPPSALLGRALETCEPRDGFQIGRVAVEILRPIPIAPLTVQSRVARPGRRVELLEAELHDDRGPLMLARAWRLKLSQLQLPPDVVPTGTRPGPGEGRSGGFFETGHDVGFHTAVDYRFVTGSFLENGPALCWIRMRVPLVAGEDPSPLQRTLVAADSGNGVSATLDYSEFLFINTDLTVSLHRLPEGEWVCLDAATLPQPHGLGLADTQLFDTNGPLGRATQTLLVARR